MRMVEALLGSMAVNRIGWALVHSLWQSTVVGLVLAVILRRLRRAPAEARYLAACISLLAMVALPVTTSVILLPAQEPVAVIGSVASASRPGAAGDVAEPIVSMRSWSSLRTAWLLQSGRPQGLLSGLVAAWMIGAAALTVRLLGGCLLVRRLGRRHARPLTAPCEEALVRLARAMRVQRGVCLLESSLIQVPMVIGGLRPVILLPLTALTGLSPGQLEALLAHELAHIHRHDYLVNLVQSAIDVLLFYHPAAWWASRVIRAERESCCDDLAVRACGDRLAYARALATMEGLRKAPHPSLAASGGPLLARVRRILNPEVEPMHQLPVAVLGATLLIGSMLLVAASAQQPDHHSKASQGVKTRDSVERSHAVRNPLFRTVYVPRFRTVSFPRTVSLRLTELVQKEIEKRTKCKVVGSIEEADAILEGTVNFAEKNVIVDGLIELPRPLTTQVQARVHWCHNPPLEAERKAPLVVFEEMANVIPDPGETTESACFSMCSNLATKIVDQMELDPPSPPTDGPVPGTKSDVPGNKEKLDNRSDLPNDQEASRTLLIGDYYQRTGKASSAEYYFGSIRARWPKSTWAAQAESRLDALTERRLQATPTPGPGIRP